MRRDTVHSREETGNHGAAGDAHRAGEATALARGGDLEEVRVDARGSDRRARAGPLHGMLSRCSWVGAGVSLYLRVARVTSC